MTGSVQQRTYLQLRANGESIEAASERSTIPLGEAELIERAIRSGDLTLPDVAPLDSSTLNHGAFAAAPGETDMADADPEFREVEDEGLEFEDPTIDLAADTLRGDVRDSVLDWIKALPKPWHLMSEIEQRDMAAAADRFAGSLVRQACQLIAASERPCIVATLTEYREKDGVEAKLKLPSKGEVVAALHEACGREVLIVTSGSEEFMGQASDAKIDADQPPLIPEREEYDERAPALVD